MHGEADAILNSETRDEFPKKQEEDNMAFGKKERPTVDKDGAALVMRKRDYLADFSGQLGLGLMANLVGQLQYFYTDKVGIAVGSVGVVMVIAKVVDALTDIWFGNIIDHSKGGNMKYYKWMLRMAVPAAVITVMMFTVPIQAGQIPAVAYALVTNLLVTAVIYTMIATPFAATMIVRTRSQQSAVTWAFCVRSATMLPAWSFPSQRFPSRICWAAHRWRGSSTARSLH